MYVCLCECVCVCMRVCVCKEGHTLTCLDYVCFDILIVALFPPQSIVHTFCFCFNFLK
jgi:hypothetical protein